MRSRKPSTRYRANPAKALVIKYFGWLVACGLAEWDARENGDVYLRFRTGETFLLADAFVIRLT